MSEPVAFSPNANGLPSFNFGNSSVAIVLSKPNNVVFHWVQTHELEGLMKVDRPFSLAIAGAATGCALGLIPTIQASIFALNDLSKIKAEDIHWDMIYAAIFALSFGVAVVTWIDAFRGKSDAKALLEEIKRRPTYPMASGQ